MQSRLYALAGIAAAVAMLAACGSPDSGDAAPARSTSIVTVTSIVAAPSTVLPPTTANQPVTTADPTTRDSTRVAGPAPTSVAPTVHRGTGASAYVGHYQRHSSTLDLHADQTGTQLLGDGAVNSVLWAINWRPAAQGIDITYDRLLRESGAGIESGPTAGRVVTADFASGETGTMVFVTSPLTQSANALTWCLPGLASPECGA